MELFSGPKQNSSQYLKQNLKSFIAILTLNSVIPTCLSLSQGNTTLTTALPFAVDNNGILINASDIKITSHYNYNCQNTLFHLRSLREGFQEFLGRGWEERQSHKSLHKKSQAYCHFEKLEQNLCPRDVFRNKTPSPYPVNVRYNYCIILRWVAQNRATVLYH